MIKQIYKNELTSIDDKFKKLLEDYNKQVTELTTHRESVTNSLLAIDNIEVFSGMEVNDTNGNVIGKVIEVEDPSWSRPIVIEYFDGTVSRYTTDGCYWNGGNKMIEVIFTVMIVKLKEK